MKKQQYAQCLISLILSIFLIFTVRYIQRYIHDYELKRINELGIFIAETDRRKHILEVLIREEEQYCDGIPWQEDSAFIKAHWDCLHSIYFSDTITLNMLDYFRKGVYFKINMSPDLTKKIIETETIISAPSSTQKRISL